MQNDGLLTGLPKIGWTGHKKRLTVSSLTLEHELCVIDCKAALTECVRERSNLSLIEFSTWPRLYQLHAFRSATGVKVLVKPDGFIRIGDTDALRTNSEQNFFLEVDRSTESQIILAQRLLCYRDYARNGMASSRLRQSTPAHKKIAFRILLVLHSEERRDNIAKHLLTLSPPVRTLVWLSTQEEFLRDPLGCVWLRPGDYLRESPTKIAML